jgi:hypothetical protein
MRRSVVFVIGLAALGTGLWLVASERTQNAACNANSSHLLGVSSSCQNVAWAYFLGFVVAGLGLIVLLFTRLMKRHELRYRGRRSSPTDLSLRLGDSQDAHSPRYKKQP